MKIEAFIIHLKRAEARRPQVDELIRQLAPTPARVLDAVDAQELSRAELEKVYQRRLFKPYYPFELRPAEIACFLSHRKAWSEIVEKRLDAGLVFEDDVGIEPNVFREAFQLAETLCDGSPAHIQFNFRKPEEGATVIAADGTARIVRPQPVLLGAMAQLVSRKAAVQLLERTEVFDRPVDVLLQMHWQTSVYPLAADPAGTVNRDMNLGGSTLHASKSVTERVWREWSRFRYRRAIRRLSSQHLGT